MFFRGYIEKVGSGTRDMIDRCREWGIEPPRWEDDEGDFAVVIRRPTAIETTLHPTLQTTLHSGLRGKEKEIIDLMLTEPEIRICEIARIVGLTRDGVNYHIRSLKKVVPLWHEGSDKSGRWVIGSKKTGRV